MVHPGALLRQVAAGVGVGSVGGGRQGRRRRTGRALAAEAPRDVQRAAAPGGRVAPDHAPTLQAPPLRIHVVRQERRVALQEAAVSVVVGRAVAVRVGDRPEEGLRVLGRDAEDVVAAFSRHVEPEVGRGVDVDLLQVEGRRLTHFVETVGQGDRPLAAATGDVLTSARSSVVHHRTLGHEIDDAADTPERAADLVPGEHPLAQPRRRLAAPFVDIVRRLPVRDVARGNRPRPEAPALVAISSRAPAGTGFGRGGRTGGSGGLGGRTGGDPGGGGLGRTTGGRSSGAGGAR